MSYCRFSKPSDVYMYPHVDKYIVCVNCKLTKKIKTVFTTGSKEETYFTKIFGEIEPCAHCKGKGCDLCMEHGDFNTESRKEAIKHLLKHREAGHIVPEDAIKLLEKEIKSFGNRV